MIAHFDCFGGISGDMALGALLDVGAEEGVLHGAVRALGLEREVSIQRSFEQRGHLGGTRLRVDISEGGPARTLPQLKSVVGDAELPDRVRSRTLDAISRLGRAEALIHGVSEADVHLHELGGADTLVDLVGAFWLLEDLGVEEVTASALPAPRGRVRDLPLPAPASLRVLEGTGAVLEPSDAGRELVTPTGAVFLAVCATFRRPSLILERTGYGLGANPAPGNAVGIWLGREPAERGEVSVLETNLDDMTPELLAILSEDLMTAGALDVSLTPLVMKKGRLGQALTVICDIPAEAGLAQMVLERSPSLGLRVTRVPRIMAAREVVSIATKFGAARVKVKSHAGHREVSAELEDVRRLALESGSDPREVQRVIELAADGLVQ